MNANARLHAAVFIPISEVLDSLLNAGTLPNPEETSPMHDAHENEYAAAVAGMQDAYGAPPRDVDPFANITADDGSAMDAFCGAQRQLPAVGDFVSGCTAGKRWSGHVMHVEANRLQVEVPGAWLIVHPGDITH